MPDNVIAVVTALLTPTFALLYVPVFAFASDTSSDPTFPLSVALTIGAVVLPSYVLVVILAPVTVSSFAVMFPVSVG